MTLKKPVVGVIGSAHTVEGKFTAQRVGERNLRAVAEAAGGARRRSARGCRSSSNCVAART
jgi:hypothetical protein